MEKYSNRGPAPQDATQPPSTKSVGKAITAIVLGTISTLYILNPTFGVDLIPDNIPIIGNLDDATAVLILMGCLRYFGLDVMKLLQFARDLPTGGGQSSVGAAPRPEKVVSPADPEVDAARQAMYAGKR